MHQLIKSSIKALPVVLAVGVLYAFATGRIRVKYPITGQDRIGHIDFVKVQESGHHVNKGIFSYSLHTPQCNYTTTGAALYEGMDLTFPASCPEEISLEGRVTAHISGCPPSRFERNKYLSLITVVYGSGKEVPRTSVEIICDE